MTVGHQLSDNNTSGTSLGQSTSDLISLYGATPIVQPSGSNQTTVTPGLQAGVITTYSSTQSPSAVAQGTTAEQTLTIQSGTGGQMLLAANDLVYVNKPTAQAGLGVGNVRVSSSNTLGITFINIPAAGGNITPTASEAYKVVAIRGMGVYALTATLSPAAVAANTSAEQTFTVVGLTPGTLVQVNKPTAQAGLDIGGCRVVSNNTLGITFMNVTSSPITPTASEVYNIMTLPGLDAINNDVMYGFNAGTVGAISAGVVVSGGSTALTGVLATDMVTGIFKPTPQATATNIATPIYGIPTANTMTMYFLGTGTGSTPTASEVYGIRTARLNPAAPLLNYTQTLTPVSVAAATTAEQTFTVTGLISGTPVWVNKASCTTGLAITGVRVSATNTLAITYANMTSSAIVPPAESYVIGNFQVPAPGAGNSVYQCVAPIVHGTRHLTNATRSALVNLGAIAGA